MADARVEWWDADGSQPTEDGVHTRIYPLSPKAKEMFHGMAYACHGHYILAAYRMLEEHFRNSHHGFGPDLDVEIIDHRMTGILE